MAVASKDKKRREICTQFTNNSAIAILFPLIQNITAAIFL